ncbi:MAG: MATE family efflux transporter [Candidatus Nealsonbacteria bacterium]|nr:MATE family efflux transporter [Candidatus Nealsonbacteria bacterium]
MNIPNIFRERDPTQGSIFKNALSMTATLWIVTGLGIVVNLLNLFWLSKIGERAIAAVAIGEISLMVMMVPIVGIITATVGLVGSFNRADQPGLDRLVKQILAFTFFTSVLLAIFGYFFAPILIRFFGAESEVSSLAVSYLRINLIGGVISFLFWPIGDMIRSTRDMLRPAVFTGLIFVLRSVFDSLLISGNLGFPEMGVVGAGLSLAGATTIGALIGFFMLASGRLFIKIDLRKWRDFKIKFKTIKEIIAIAGFDTLEGLTRTIAGMAMLAIVASFGTQVLTASSIGQRFLGYASMLGVDFGKTTAITVSNNLGVGDIRRAEKSGWIISGINVGILGILGLIFFIFAGQIIGIFSKDREILTIGITYFRITTLCGLGYVFFAAGQILQRAFAGAKDTKTPMLIYWIAIVLQLGLAFLLPKYWGLGINGVWIAILIGMIFYGLSLIVLFKIGYWKPKMQIKVSP